MKGVISALFGWNVVQIIITILAVLGGIGIVVWILGLIDFI